MPAPTMEEALHSPSGAMRGAAERAALLRRFALLDASSEEGFDRLTRLTARSLRAPTAAVSIMGDQRLLPKSLLGFPEPVASSREYLAVLAHELRNPLAAIRTEVEVLRLRGEGTSGTRVVLRRNPATASIHLVALPGYGQSGDRRRSRESGFARHVTKPADPRELEAILEAVSAARRQQG